MRKRYQINFANSWALGDGDGQGGLACCDSSGGRESDRTERLNWTELSWRLMITSCFSPKHMEYNLITALSWIWVLKIYQTKDIFQEFRTMDQDIYWKQDHNLGALSVQFSCSVMSNSLQPHELQHIRPPCPSPSPGVHSNSYPLSQWCHPASHPLSSPSPPAPNPSQHQSLFQWVNSSHEVAKVLEFQL